MVKGMRALSHRKGGGPPTFRYNPRTRIGRFSVRAYALLSCPDYVGVYHHEGENRVYFIPDDKDEDNTRRVSESRTFTITALREFQPESKGPRSWGVSFSYDLSRAWINLNEENVS